MIFIMLLSDVERLEEFVNGASTIGKGVLFDAHFVEQRQMQIGQWCRFVELDVTPRPACCRRLLPRQESGGSYDRGHSDFPCHFRKDTKSGREVIHSLRESLGVSPEIRQTTKHESD